MNATHLGSGTPPAVQLSHKFVQIESQAIDGVVTAQDTGSLRELQIASGKWSKRGKVKQSAVQTLSEPLQRQAAVRGATSHEGCVSARRVSDDVMA